MAAAKDRIINRALVKLGSRPIVNLEDDDTPESRTMLNLWDMCLAMILSETLWTFATRRTLLAVLSEEVAFEREFERLPFVYQRPTKIVRVFHTNDTAGYFKEEGDTIVSDIENLGIIYTYLHEDPAVWPPHFATALSDLLAAEAAYPLLNSTSKTTDMQKFYEGVSLPKALSQNAQIGTPKELNDNFYLNAKFGGANVEEHS